MRTEFEKLMWNLCKAQDTITHLVEAGLVETAHPDARLLKVKLERRKAMDALDAYVEQVRAEEQERWRPLVQRLLAIFQGDWPNVNVQLVEGRWTWLPVDDEARDAIVAARKAIQRREKMHPLTVELLTTLRERGHLNRNREDDVWVLDRIKITDAVIEQAVALGAAAERERCLVAVLAARGPYEVPMTPSGSIRMAVCDKIEEAIRAEGTE